MNAVTDLRTLLSEIENTRSVLRRIDLFKRYYVEFEYDWDRIDYLQRKYEQLQPLIARDFDRFTAFLRATERRAGNDS